MVRKILANLEKKTMEINLCPYCYTSISGDNFNCGDAAILRLPLPEIVILKLTASFTITVSLFIAAFIFNFPTTPEKLSGCNPGSGFTLTLTDRLLTDMGTV